MHRTARRQLPLTSGCFSDFMAAPDAARRAARCAPIGHPGGQCAGRFARSGRRLAAHARPIAPTAQRSRRTDRSAVRGLSGRDGDSPDRDQCCQGTQPRRCRIDPRHPHRLAPHGGAVPADPPLRARRAGLAPRLAATAGRRASRCGHRGTDRAGATLKHCRRVKAARRLARGGFGTVVTQPRVRSPRLRLPWAFCAAASSARTSSRVRLEPISPARTPP